MSIKDSGLLNLVDHGGKGPLLVLLHGFLGSGRDWDAVLPLLTSSFHCLTVDLPGHGQSPMVIPDDLNGVAHAVQQTLLEHGHHCCAVLGYSLGGRVALALAKQVPQLVTQLFLEGSHPGLVQASEKAARWQNDQGWAQRFEQEPLSQVLDDWYRQLVFSSLQEQERCRLVAERSQQSLSDDSLFSSEGMALAAMLRSCSLARQPDFRPVFTQQAEQNRPVVYLVGEHDQKFRLLAEQLSADGLVRTGLVPAAGHNAHRDNPSGFAQALLAGAQANRFL
ncbi:2-succinyl-6-hydroxy-2,4-cyclohexadiene-1-carboxylate synthase [Parendozoicomonas haliclonae]|uniref:Putative 2-succinyl-6-hydroxy-2,4-cyclohexadiene-1-carboxylate synthase n=1 Tax=Parendozoicomonas haliclonae TaxID=1960125 RepID=A0A1X7AMG1_9GAMM|nr:2-succinyl-6-hydroxy-2,4-cyclohexadiene-1-carboxylate synthase [Parendozoicomonas haliclonae]SMA49445.1 2-succinyl-6-hydroxy-2, 4-cyclohexadiene-1-carboxylate synthase [Parendozoicomonas haliclonae]